MASNEKAELHKTIWKIANDLRGSVDGWDFKQYVLGTLFYRFISENLANYLNEHQHKAGIKDFDFAKLKDKEVKLLIFDKYLRETNNAKEGNQSVANFFQRK